MRTQVILDALVNVLIVFALAVLPLPAVARAENYPKLPYRATVLKDHLACVSDEAHHRWSQYIRVGDQVAAEKIVRLYCTWFRKGDAVIVLDDYNDRMRVKRPGDLTEYNPPGFKFFGRWHDGPGRTK